MRIKRLTKSRRFVRSALAGVLFVLVAAGPGFASGVVEFGPGETTIEGSIRYTVIGHYEFEFDRFKGEIAVDEDSREILDVYLEIEAESIGSECLWCDKIVRSEQLLHTEKHPLIVFKSQKIFRDEEGYQVTGILDMHGKTKEMTFPFSAEFITDEQTGENGIAVNGRWVINRKDFDIIWNRLLDVGGVLVGNHITVEWGIRSAI